MSKTLHNSTVDAAKKNVSDLVTFGNGDTFKLICKASSKAEGWMKSTKAMEIPGVGCAVQITTQQGDNVAEALTFIPGVKIEEIDGDKKNGRKLVSVLSSTETCPEAYLSQTLKELHEAVTAGNVGWYWNSPLEAEVLNALGLPQRTPS